MSSRGHLANTTARQPKGYSGGHARKSPKVRGRRAASMEGMREADLRRKLHVIVMTIELALREP